MSDKISKLLGKLTGPELAKLQAYIPSGKDKHKDYIRLDAMECPYGFSQLGDELSAKWLEKIKGAEVNRYPAGLSDEMKNNLQRQLGIAPTLDILPGNGSDELILLLMLLCGVARGGKLLSPSPSFSMYQHVTQALGGKYVGVDLESDFSLDQDKFVAKIREEKPQLVFIAQPNNPTGNLFSPEVIRAAAEANADNGLVVIDRAYDFFCDKGGSGQDGTIYEEFPNLVELRTLSKIGMAGLRFGIVAAAGEVIGELNKLRLPYNVNVLSWLSIEFALQHLDEFKGWAAEIVAERDKLSKGLQGIDRSADKLEVFPSETNFIIFRLTGAGCDAQECQSKLAAAKVLVKSFDGYHPLTKNCIRVSIGSPQENEVFLRELRKIL